MMGKENNEVFRLGVTGGIGSGKTSVCRVFDVLGIPVFSADREAQVIMETDNSVIHGLNSITDKELYVAGKLDRMLLASIIFNDSSVIEKVNSLVHPVVFDRFRNWTQNQSAPYVIMEAAILFESGASKYVDKIATVAAPVEQRIERVIRRNKLTREQVIERMRNQMDDAERIQLADYVINNAENDMIIPSILKIHEDILTLLKMQS
jgi:dephospho-CoA kinase